MSIYFLLLIAVGLAVDAFLVSIALGSIYRKRNGKQVLFSSGVFGFSHMFFISTGWVIGSGFKTIVSGLDHWIAFFLLLWVGFKMIYDAFFSNHHHKIEKVLPSNKLISLAIATSIDTLAVGMGFALIGFDFISIPLSVGTVAFMLSLIGMVVGARFQWLLKVKMGVVGGIFLIAIGSKILLDHLFF